ncbi:phytanoyl-CoA dioxygenase family protein [Candidatus Poribacteria bacterium]|nr:phytanoyl-CoA dioxygenase family protein [Candidatus Poribacteria bacterium]
MNQPSSTNTQNTDQVIPPIMYPENLYQFDTVAYSISGGFSSVTDADISYFHQHGYLVIEDGFSPKEVKTALEGMVYLMDGNNPDFKAIQFEPKLAKAKDEMNPSQRRDAIRKIFNYVSHEPRLNAIADHPGLTGVLQRIMDDTPILFQDMALVKPPHFGSEKPWHQDLAYFNLQKSTTVVGVWVALDEATAENGCMHIIPGSHIEGPMIHFKRRDWQICDTHVPISRDTMVPLKPGGCLFWHGLLHHGSPANQTSNRRRALQLHYKPESAEEISTQDRMDVYGSDGKDVDC